MDNVQEIFSAETAFLPEHEGISAIVSNPFRVLGVYANATPKEITANARKIKRFIEVGKPVEFPSDLNNLLPSILRTAESVDAAMATLSNPREKFKAALYWFAKTDDIDGIGMDHLQASNIAKAQEILSKRHDWHSCLNLSTLHFALKHFEEAVNLITSSIYKDRIHIDIAKNVCGEEFEISDEETSRMVINALLEDISIPECRILYKNNGYSQSDDDYLNDLLSSKYTKLINDAIASAKNISKNNSQEALEAGRRLKETTKEPLEEFAQYLGEDSAEYGMLADRLANQILQCAIDYYNDSIDRFAVFDSLELMEYALSIVKGQAKKERCQQNVDILKRNAANVPPREVADDDDFLSSFLSEHKNDEGTIENAWYILEQGTPSIIHIKECLSKIIDNKSDAYARMNNYLNMVSTALVNLSLNKAIAAVNSATKFQLDLLFKAWDLILNMEQFPMNQEFMVQRFSKNKSTLRSLVSLDGIIKEVPTKPTRSIDMRTSEEVWNDCHTIQDFENYIKRYPKGNHVQAAKSRIEILKIIEEDRLWETSKKSEDYYEYISKYPNGRYTEEAVKAQRVVDRKRDDAAFSDCKNISDYERYIANYPHGRHIEAAKEKLAELIAEDDKIWASCKTKADCNNYLTKHADGKHIDDAKAKIASAEKVAKIWWSVICAEVVTILILLAKIFSSPSDFSGISAAIILVSFVVITFYLAIKYYK